jgi:ubiquinone biosynthesis protein
MQLLQNRFFRTAYAIMQIFRVLAAYLWYRFATYYVVGPGNRRQALDKVHERCADSLFLTFANLRGAYIKLGQFLSTQAVLPQAYLLQFVRMQDQVTPVDYHLVEKALHEEWGPDWRAKLTSLDPKPLAAASIAQVHRAVLADGRDVVVKVQYPGIKRFFSKDLALVGFMLPIYIKIIQAAFPDLRSGLDTNAMIRELFTYINMELDYRNEVRNQLKMGKHFATWKTVVVPELVPELCTDHVICMKYYEGTKIVDWFGTVDQEKQDMLFETFVDFALYTWVVKGCFQADSHPGNFLVTPDERLVLLDFGCVKEFKPAYRQGTIKTVQAYLNRDTKMAAQVLWDLGFRTQNGTVESLEEWVKYGHKVTDLVVDHFKQGHDLIKHLEANLQELATEAIGLNRDHALAHVPEEFMLLGRAFATSPVPFEKYTPQVDVVPMALEHLAEASLEDEAA